MIFISRLSLNTSQQSLFATEKLNIDKDQTSAGKDTAETTIRYRMVGK